MTPNVDTDQVTSLQRDYYHQTAEDYDAMHPRDEHLAALQHAARFLRAIGAKSVLDTGCAAAGAQVLVLPTSPPRSWAAQAAPLLFASHCLVVALKTPLRRADASSEADPAGIN
jgi:hypothetical protein